MGRNFYAVNDRCVYCGRSSADPIHLGKSSAGWKFTLQANDFEFYKNWREMKEWLKGKTIVDEYDGEFSREEFILWVENRQDIEDPTSEVPYDSMKRRQFVIDGYKFHNYEFC